MADRNPFSLYRRPTKNGKPIWYVKLRAPGSGKYSAWRSTGKTSKKAALAVALQLFKAGIDGSTENLELVSFLLDFWNYNTSKYVRGKLAREGGISRSYCHSMTLLVEKHVKPHLEGKRILGLTAEIFDDWMATLKSKGLGHRVINLARQAVNVPLNYLVELRRLPWNPLAAAKPYHETHKRRGIISLSELRALLALEGMDPRVRVAIALGSLCGMRLGEIRGLKWGDVDAELGIVRIQRSYVLIDGERPQAKHGSNRDVPLPSPAADALEAWRKISPARGPSDYILAHVDHIERPIAPGVVLDAFYRALMRIEVSKAARLERNIVFHSLRHWYNTILRNSIPDSVLRRLTGHRSEAMTDIYDHGKEIDFQAARKRLEDLVATGQ